MAINLEKNRSALLAAWSDVLDEKTPTNWALFGYEGLSNDLKLISKGSDGVEEMVEDLNSGKIMYAFLRVIDPKTSLPKNVLINWQGEGAPNVRKGTCANHIRDVSNLFKGAHVTLNARNEEEVDSSLIIDKVSKSTGSVYKFTERTEPTNDSGPIGTSYKRTIPKQEINSMERDKFWEKQEAEEKQRQESERLRREEECKRLEEERRKRDSEETTLRESKIRETTKSIEQIKLAEKISFERSQTAKSQPVEDLEREELERRNRADVLRRQRSEEAQALISKRTIDARAIFEQNTSAGQLKQRRSSVQPREGNGLSAVQRRSSEIPQTTSQRLNPPAPVAVVKQEAEETPPAPVGNGVNGGVKHQLHEDETQEWEDEVKHEIPVTHTPTDDQLLLPPEQFINGDFGSTARAIYDYQAADETEITFDPGDLITHVDQIDEGWWQGLGPDGTYGLFPANYVELIK